MEKILVCNKEIKLPWVKNISTHFFHPIVILKEDTANQTETRSKGSVNLPQGSVKLVVLCKVY